MKSRVYYLFLIINVIPGIAQIADPSESLNETDPIKSIVNNYKNHPVIKKIKSKYITVKPFSSWPVTFMNVLDVITTLDGTKSSGGDVTLRTLNGNKIFPQVLCKWINDSLKTGAFLDPLEFAEITSIHKKEEPLNKDNYQPISILLLISKVFEKIIYSQVYSYTQQYLNPLLCRLRQSHGTQHVLFWLLQAWQKELNQVLPDSNGFIESLRLSTQWLNYCKIWDIWFWYHTLKLFHSYFSNRKQRLNIGSAISKWIDILTGIL